MRIAAIMLMVTFATQAEAMITMYEFQLQECKKSPTSKSCQSICSTKSSLKKEDGFQDDKRQICQTFCSDPKTLELEGCKDFPIVERFKDAKAEKMINNGKVLSTETKGRRTILFLNYRNKIYSCTLSTRSNSTTTCERSISR